LFSVLIIDITNCGKKNVVLVATETVPVKIVKTAAENRIKAEDKNIRSARAAQTITLPLKKTAMHCVKKPIAATAVRKNYVVNGNVFVDGEFPGEDKLYCGAKINGNLYLQNMRRYTLPCDTVIQGNLFLRNVEMLRFCGSFTVTGNIYVSHHSSFGPIPPTARIGGQIIL
jgi:hypothetical protein